jgi:plastocyanin
LKAAGICALAVCLAGASSTAFVPASQGASITGTVSIVRKSKGAPDNGEVAVWLKPIAEAGQRAAEPPLPHARPRIAQQNKRFEPRFLVVPVGSIVDFPNFDPFFHNVFSLFDGKRFDLGLYEAGTSRSVPFTRAGVCYIFCNIHPEMSAVVVVVDTPYYATTNRAGDFTVPNVPPGRYAVSVWNDRARPEWPADVPHDVTVASPNTSLGVIRLVESEDMITPHKNKYGHDYVPATNPLYKGGRGG